MSGIKFNKRDNSFSCRTKTGLPGQLSFVSCRTPSECAVNRICLERVSAISCGEPENFRLVFFTDET